MMIQESKLRQGKGDTMFILVKSILSGIPLKIRLFFQKIKIERFSIYVNIIIWLNIWFLSL